MAKFYGKIGFIETKETTPGVWTEVETERMYYGDITKNARRWSATSGNLNDDLNVTNSISIIADAYAYNNFHSMRYVEFMGALWKVSYVEVQRPRLILTIGGVYNEQTSGTS